MDAVFALILPLVGGFFVIREATFIKYQAAREDGHRLYFRIAWYGFWLFLASFLILGSLRAILSVAGIPLYGDVEHTVLPGLAPFMKEGQQSAARVGFVTVCAFAMILGRFSPPVINRFTKKSSLQALMEATSQNELEELLVDAVAMAKRDLREIQQVKGGGRSRRDIKASREPGGPGPFFAPFFAAFSGNRRAGRVAARLHPRSARTRSHSAGAGRAAAGTGARVQPSSRPAPKARAEGVPGAEEEAWAAPARPPAKRWARG